MISHSAWGRKYHRGVCVSVYKGEGLAESTAFCINTPSDSLLLDCSVETLQLCSQRQGKCMRCTSHCWCSQLHNNSCVITKVLQINRKTFVSQMSLVINHSNLLNVSRIFIVHSKHPHRLESHPQ